MQTEGSYGQRMRRPSIFKFVAHPLDNAGTLHIGLSYRCQRHPERLCLERSHGACHYGRPQTHSGSANRGHRGGNVRRRAKRISRRARNGPGFLQCRAVKAACPTVATMYSTRTDSIMIQVHAYMWHQTAKVLALLDSGATENFIDKRMVKTLGLGTRLLSSPLDIHNVDRTLNREGRITHYADLWV